MLTAHLTPARLGVILMVLLALAAVVLLLVFKSSGGGPQIDLDSALVTPDDLESVSQPGPQETPAGTQTCLASVSSVKDRMSVGFLRPNGRLYIGEELLVYETREQASNAIAMAPETWAACTYGSWRLAPEELSTPSLGDESNAFFISADCCYVVDPEAAQPNGHLYALFVRHGNVVGLITVITRDPNEFDTIARVADAIIVRALAAQGIGGDRSP